MESKYNDSTRGRNFRSALRNSAVGQRQTVHVPQQYIVNHQVVAEIILQDRLPILQVYTHDQWLAAFAIGALQAENFLRYYQDYMQYLPQLIGFTTLKQLTDYKNDIVRSLDFNYVHHDLTAFCLEINRTLARLRFQQKHKELPEDLRERDLTVADLHFLLAMNDLQKGLEAGSSAVRELKKDNQLSGLQLIHTVDSPSLGALGSHSIAIIRYTPHYRVNLDKPQMTFSLTFTPGLASYSMSNDKGLVITRNEATKKENCFTAVENGIPESILIQILVENCSTVAEVLQLLDELTPASSHILTLMDAKKNAGVLEILPINKPAKSIFRPINEEVTDNSRLSKSAVKKLKSYGKYVLATNHFITSKDIGSGTQHEPQMNSLTRPSSLDRFRNMHRAIDSQHSSKQVIKNAGANDTVQAMRFQHYDDAGLKLTVTWGNAKSANNVKHEAYSRLNLSQAFEKFHLAACHKFFPQDVPYDEDEHCNEMSY